MKKITAFIVALAMMLVMVPTASAAGEFRYTELIKPQYEDAKPLGDGLAAVKKDGKWGFVDKSNKTVIDFKYDYAAYFNEGKAIVGTLATVKEEYGDYKVIEMGSVDASGVYTAFKTRGSEPVSVYAYDGTVPDENFIYYNGYAIIPAGEGANYCIDTKGKEIDIFKGSEFSTPYAMYAPTEGFFATGVAPTDYFEYTDMQGNVLFPNHNFHYGQPFNQGLAPVGIYSEEMGDYWYFIDTTGKRALPINFTNFYKRGTKTEHRIFCDGGLASLADMYGRWGAINKAGKTVIPFKYDELRSFSEGLASFMQDGKYGYINVQGKVVIAPQFDDVSTFSGGVAVARIGNTAYCIDKTGSKIVGADKLPVSTYFVENGTNDDGSTNYTVYAPGSTVVIEENGKYGYGSVEYTPALPEKSEMSTWAYSDVIEAIEKDLVPASMQNMYTSNTTRVDFAALVVTALEETLGKDIRDIVKEKTGETLYELVAKYPFKDTTDYDVIAAYALGIVSGDGKGGYKPDNTITRQDAAILLTKTAQFLGYEAGGQAGVFVDEAGIAAYAKESVGYASRAGLMGGVGNDKFAPKGSYTREQTYVTMLRLFKAITEK